jgi:protein-S-isoprenylcysteine O-methyltransferase Ste14
MSIRDMWIGFLHRTATGTRTTRSLLTPVGIAIFAGFTAVFVLAALQLDRLAGLPGLVPDHLRAPVSIPLLILGAGLTFWSGFHFLKVKGTPVPFNPPPVVVATGPYRYARNPMLTGVFLFLFGLGFAFDSPSLVFVFTPLFILANIWELRTIEEPELVRRLGDEYVAYRDRTPMFVPGLGRPRDGLE